MHIKRSAYHLSDAFSHSNTIRFLFWWFPYSTSSVPATLLSEIDTSSLLLLLLGKLFRSRFTRERCRCHPLRRARIKRRYHGNLQQGCDWSGLASWRSRASLTGFSNRIQVSLTSPLLKRSDYGDITRAAIGWRLRNINTFFALYIVNITIIAGPFACY